MVAFIDAYREAFGVEPICRVLQTAPSWYYEQKARAAQPARVPTRTQHDAVLRPVIDRLRCANRRAYGAEKVWRALHREGERLARCTVARLMKAEGLRGVVRGRRVRTIDPRHACGAPTRSRAAQTSPPCVRIRCGCRISRTSAR